MRSKQQCKKSASHITTKIPHPENNQPFEKPPGGKHLPHIHRHTQIQSTKKILVHPKYEIIKVLSNYQVFSFALLKLSLLILFASLLILFSIVLSIVFNLRQRQLEELQLYGHQFREEDINQCTKPIENMKQRDKRERQLLLSRR